MRSFKFIMRFLGISGTAMKYVVQYGYMRLCGVFSYSEAESLCRGCRVIVRSSRGQEIGTVRCEATPEMSAKLDENERSSHIIRTATQADELECQEILKQEEQKKQRCRHIVDNLGLVLELVRIEQIFGGERLIVYYTASGRVDFRELIKVLADEFRTRIEMRQINIREELRFMPYVGVCGREVCCSCFLRNMPPVTIKMAKLQKVTLDPSKTVGHCGRLKCCLRYEYGYYAEDQSKKNE